MLRSAPVNLELQEQLPASDVPQSRCPHPSAHRTPHGFKAEQPPSVLEARLSVCEVLGTHTGVRKSPLPVTCATPGTTTGTAPKALGTRVAQPEPGGLTDRYTQWPQVSCAVLQAWGP